MGYMGIDYIKDVTLNWTIDPKPDEIILVSGNAYAGEVLASIKDYCLRMRSRVISNIFSDDEIIRMLKHNVASEISNVWIPEVITHNTFRFKNKVHKLDKIILLFTDFIFDSDLESNQGLLQLKEMNLSNLSQYSRYQVKTILLEYPKESSMRKYYYQAYNTNYHQMANLNQKLMNILQKSNQITLRCPQGSYLSFYRDTRTIYNEDCSFDSDHLFQLPGGEIFFAPIEEKTQGEVYIQGESIGLEQDFKLIIDNGKVVDLLAPYDAALRNRICQILGIPGEIVGEIGIGTNSAVDIKSSCSLYEKKLTTAHIALGENIYYGGNHSSSRHVDLVIEKPSIWVDGQLIIQKGYFKGGT